MIRSARLVAVGAVAALALTGCGDAPVRAGAAAIVGDSRVTAEQLAQAVDDGLRDPGAQQLAADRPAFQREVLGRIVQGEVIDAAAARRGVTVTQGEIDEQYAAVERSVGGAEQLQTQAAAAGYTLDGVRELARREALRQALADSLTADVPVSPEQLQQAYDAGDFDQVRVAMIQVADLAAAQALLPQATGLDDAAFAELARTRSLDEGSKERGGDLGLAPRSAFTEGLEEFGAAAFSAQVGDTFAVASPSGGHVVRVLERRTTSLEEATPQLRRAVLQQQQADAVAALLDETARDLGITINPRFGTWDSTEQAVVARADSGDRDVSRPAGGDGSGDGDGSDGGSDGAQQPQEPQPEESLLDLEQQ